MVADKVYIVIPVFNEVGRLAPVIRSVFNEGYQNVIIVDDGSSDGSGALAQTLGAKVLIHPLNLGVGAATQTGIAYALKNGADIIVSLDGDGQHDAGDIKRLISKLESDDLDLVIGNRFEFKENKIPGSRLFYNRWANFFAFIFTGIRVPDSQSGFRAMQRRFAIKSEMHWNGFEFCIEQLRYVRINHSKLGSVPIKVQYTRETMKKGQNLFTGIRMLGNLIRRHS